MPHSRSSPRRLRVGLVFVTFWWAGWANGWAAQEITDTEDIMFRHDGAVHPGRVVDLDDQYLSVQVRLDATAMGTISVPREGVSRVEFYVPPAEDALLATGGRARMEELVALWRERRKFLGLQNSNTGRIALVLGEALLETGDPEDARRAMALFSLVEAEDWNTARHPRAQQGRLRAMIALGDAEAAVAEALQVADEAEAPEVLLEAKLVLAEAAFNELEELEEEHPRWEEDDRVRPDRNRLYHETIDRFLYPYLFFGSEEDAAARGLWGAIRLYRFAGETVQARECARDLTILYPNTPVASEAREWLEAQDQETKETEL